MSGPPDPPELPSPGGNNGNDGNNGNNGNDSNGTSTDATPSTPSYTGTNGSTSSAPADPLRAYRDILLQMGINPGPFVGIMSQASGENWTAQEFLWALQDDPKFNRMFPGIGTFLDQGMSIPEAVRTYKATTAAYQQALKDAGLWGYAKGKMTPQNMGLAIENGIDPTEMVFRMSIAEQAKRSDEFRQEFNKILKSKGQQQLDKAGWVDFLLGRSDAKLYDEYESVSLLSQLGPEGLSIKQARQLGRAVGPKGEYTDVSDALATVEQIRSALGSQQLADAGIRTADLALAALSQTLTSPDKKAKASQVLGQIEQLQTNATARSNATDNSAIEYANGRPIEFPAG